MKAPLDPDRPPLTLAEMETALPHMLRSADLEERRNAKRSRAVHTVSREIALLEQGLQALRRDLDGAPPDLDAVEARLDEVAAILAWTQAALGLDEAPPVPGPVPLQPRRAPEPRPPVSPPPPVLVGSRLLASPSSSESRLVLHAYAPGFEDATEVRIEIWDRSRSTLLGRHQARVVAEEVEAEVYVPRGSDALGGVRVHLTSGDVDSWTAPVDVDRDEP